MTLPPTLEHPVPRKPRPNLPRQSNNPHVAARRALSGGAMYAPIPGALAAHRNARGMSQAALADAADCSKSMIGHIEAGRRDRITGALAGAITEALTPAPGDVAATLARLFVPITATSQGSDTPDTQP